MSRKEIARAMFGIGLALLVSGLVTGNLPLMILGLALLFLALKELRSTPR